MSVAQPHSPTPAPRRIERQVAQGVGVGLLVEWPTDSPVTFSSLFLRKNCPCAECLEKRGEGSHEKPLSGVRPSLRVIKNTVEEETDLTEIWLVGNYALGMKWKDGHSSGIYSWPMMRSLMELWRNEEGANRT